MLFMKKILHIIVTVVLFVQIAAAQDSKVEKWDFYELSLPGPTAGDPFIGIDFSAVFSQGDRRFEPEGFYDGGGIFKIRFMPNKEGIWTYKTKSNCDALNGKTGQFECIAPSPDNHGPVRISDQYQFGYEDETPFFPFGTTIYEWPFRSDEIIKQTVENLKDSPFNKARFLVIPPYKDYYLTGPGKLDRFPFEGNSKENWDFSRFNTEFFRGIEQCISQLRDIGVQADVILFRPYDDGKWGFDRMDAQTNDRYLRYCIARFAAFRNVWWSLANENSFIKSMTDADWDRLFQIVQAKDPYRHLRSIHNADRIYDYNKPWVTHVSLQYYMAVRFYGVSPLLRDIYKKPIIHDEINYEGDIDSRWGQLTAEEMTYRFWIAIIGGAYATHGEVFKSPNDTTWTSRGGTLKGHSPERIAFLRKIVEDGPSGGMTPIDSYFETNIAGRNGEYYLIYFGKDAVKEWPFALPAKKSTIEDGDKFKAEIIDTWNMTITPVKDPFVVEKQGQYKFVDKNKSVIQLPGKPYMALRIRRIK
jgi:hypothetical protein